MRWLFSRFLIMLRVLSMMLVLNSMVLRISDWMWFVFLFWMNVIRKCVYIVIVVSIMIVVVVMNMCSGL